MMLHKTFAAAALATVLAALTTLPAIAQDAATTPTPPAATEDETAPIEINNADQNAARANAEWARKVMAGESTDDQGKAQADEKGCVRNPDRKAHGVVWGEVGSGGYKSGGAIATQPVGDCSSITVGYEQTHGGNGNYRRDPRRR